MMPKLMALFLEAKEILKQKDAKHGKYQIWNAAHSSPGPI